jgi:hypothetical protein
MILVLRARTYWRSRDSSAGISLFGYRNRWHGMGMSLNKTVFPNNKFLTPQPQIENRKIQIFSSF